ncbi:MAG: hypothetical protein EKK63_05020 [Acinetobacter sp.]|uniref:hypothetical protein n=1 Tax=Acinetobacter sp. TaxID=472 RepID=UPI000FB63DEA|nr:hypothetical protein [Acinetobacter sp.]RUP41619.1 MAG: hypothetical protein EKK63_05020 [Acinetobacter sp.]
MPKQTVVATTTFKEKGLQECSLYRELIQVGAMTVQGLLVVAVAVGTSPSFPSVFIGNSKTFVS